MPLLLCCGCCSIKFLSNIFNAAFSFSNSSIFLAIKRSLARLASRDFFADMLFLERFLQYLSSLHSSGTAYLSRFHSLSEPVYWGTRQWTESGLLAFCCGTQWGKLLPEPVTTSGWGNRTFFGAAGLQKAIAALTSNSSFEFVYVILCGGSWNESFWLLNRGECDRIWWHDSRFSNHSKADETMSSLVNSGVNWKSKCSWPKPSFPSSENTTEQGELLDTLSVNCGLGRKLSKPIKAKIIN